MMSTSGDVWKLSAISEVNKILSRKSWIPKKTSNLKSKGKKPVSVKWVFKSKEEADGLIDLKLINLV